MIQNTPIAYIYAQPLYCKKKSLFFYLLIKLLVMCFLGFLNFLNIGYCFLHCSFFILFNNFQMSTQSHKFKSNMFQLHFHQEEKIKKLALKITKTPTFLTNNNLNSGTTDYKKTLKISLPVHRVFKNKHLGQKNI